MPRQAPAPSNGRSLLETPIRELGLALEGSQAEGCLRRLHRELGRRGLKHFRPPCYLTDEWGCPDGVPVIGVPFYLADPALARIEQAMDGLEDERQIMMYMRHEAGHAFNYAYRLHRTTEWRKLFGPFQRRYRDHYRPIPFSRKYVRHLEGWYAQKHPDEDFAETFAVWLTPRSDWKSRYRGWPALAKLRYVERVARRVADRVPLVQAGELHLPVDKLSRTVKQHYRRLGRGAGLASEAPIAHDLGDVFRADRKGGGRMRPAWELIEAHRGLLTRTITYWTGVRRPVVRALVDRMIQDSRARGFHADVKQERAYIVELTAYGTALAMSYLARGRFA